MAVNAIWRNNSSISYLQIKHHQSSRDIFDKKIDIASRKQNLTNKRKNKSDKTGLLFHNTTPTALPKNKELLTSYILSDAFILNLMLLIKYRKWIKNNNKKNWGSAK